MLRNNLISTRFLLSRISSTFVLAFLQIRFYTSLAIPIDNGVIGTPEVSCGQKDMSILFNTEQQFAGRIFAKGFADTPGCFLRGEGTRSVSVSFNLNTQACGIRRLRSVEPRGMQIMVITVISFHNIFLTKVDKAYRLSCFYMEADKLITSELEVQMLTTEVITNSVPMPLCKYEILRGNKDGPPVRFVKIGDPVYHKWSCSTSSPNNFCMRVHSCTVDDGSGSNKVPVINKEGCSVDHFVIGDLDYDDDMSVGREAHVFKFADHPLVFFNCQVELSLKEGAQCRLVKPKCQEKQQAKVRRALNGKAAEPPPLFYPGRRIHPDSFNSSSAASHDVDNNVNRAAAQNTNRQTDRQVVENRIQPPTTEETFQTKFAPFIDRNYPNYDGLEHDIGKNSDGSNEIQQETLPSSFYVEFDLPPRELTVLDIDENISARSVSQSIQDELRDSVREEIVGFSGSYHKMVKCACHPWAWL